MAATPAQQRNSLAIEIFPRNQYKGAGKKLVLHFLIALGQSQESILKWVEKKKELINFQSPDYYSLSPMHVAAMKGRLAVVEGLAKRGAETDLADHRGWLPIDHARLAGHEKVIEWLGGGEDRFKGVLDPEFPEDDTVVCKEVVDGEIRRVTSAEFTRRTGAKFYDGIVATPKGLEANWKEMDVSLLEREKLVAEFERCKGTKHIALKEGGIVALKDFEAYEGVAIYGGICEGKEPDDKTYLLGDINGHPVRNLGPMLNDSFPNCIIMQVVIDGILYHMLVTLEKVAEGDELVWNYGGNHECKYRERHIELNPEGLLNFKHSLENFPQRGDFPLVTREQLDYFLSTPSSWLWLVSQKKLTEIAIFFQDFDGIASIVKSSVSHLEKRKSFFADLTVFAVDLNRAEGEVAENAQRAFLRWSQLPAIAVMNAFSMVRDDFSMGCNHPTEWKKLIRWIDELTSFLTPLDRVLMGDREAGETLGKAFVGLSDEMKSKVFRHLEVSGKTLPMYEWNRIIQSLQVAGGLNRGQARSLLRKK